MVNIDKAIDNALTLFEADLMTDVTLELTTSSIFMTRRKLIVTGEGWKIKSSTKTGQLIKILSNRMKRMKMILS